MKSFRIISFFFLIFLIAPGVFSFSAVQELLPLNLNRIKEDLTANDLEILEIKKMKTVLYRLTLKRGDRIFRAKWKIIGKKGGDTGSRKGNNAPRCETASYWLNEAVWGENSTRHHLVPPVVVRAFHTNTPECGKACKHLAGFKKVYQFGSFPDINDHLVIGTLTYWMEGVKYLDNFTTGRKPHFFDRQRFKESLRFRKSFSDLNLFVYLIEHGDANHCRNFLITDDLQRVFSVDNGHTFDGKKFWYKYEWYGFRHFKADDLSARTYSRDTANRLNNLNLKKLEKRLRITALVNLDTGETILNPPKELTRKPLSKNPGFKRRHKGVYTGTWKNQPWAAWGIEEQGIKAVFKRIKKIRRLLGTKYPLFP